MQTLHYCECLLLTWHRALHTPAGTALCEQCMHMPHLLNLPHELSNSLASRLHHNLCLSNVIIPQTGPAPHV